MRRLRLQNDYGGKGPLTFPADHVPAIRVPRGGSSCANCMFVDAARHECKEPHYIEWNGGPKLPPLPLDEICSDWYDWPGSAEQQTNPREPELDYYIWTMNQRGEVVGQSIKGPHARRHALSSAAAYARGSALDRAVSFGSSPTAPSFRIVAAYEARTGRQLL
ncbi:MAG TPA: hypothetical protein VGB13_10985 [Candidatus Krumholzibacteria bacterium]